MPDFMEMTYQENIDFTASVMAGVWPANADDLCARTLWARSQRKPGEATVLEADLARRKTQ